ncbi:MAG: subclass B1 metallo-beta-lactamase, partial [Chitinophagia bacterium]|nr:subclass B1 metallo-beta-lactamase [Chitinophagia bacterium]
NGSLYPANGMYVVTPAGALLFDSPWDTTQLQPLADSIAARHHTRIIYQLATHFHSDRTAGLAYYAAHGVATWSTEYTHDLCVRENEPLAEHTFAGDTTFTIGGEEFRVVYPGKGHAPDNIVVWFPKEGILYGGCFIKSTETNDLGNLGDADPKAWAASLRKVQQQFPHPRYVIPGHLSWASVKSVQHTAHMVRRYNRRHH